MSKIIINITRQLTSQHWCLQIFHLAKGDHQRKFFISYVKLEKRSSSDDLQIGQHDSFDVDMRDEHVASHFANVLQKAEIIVGIGEPGQFKVAIHIGTIGVTIA